MKPCLDRKKVELIFKYRDYLNRSETVKFIENNLKEGKIENIDRILKRYTGKNIGYHAEKYFEQYIDEKLIEFTSFMGILSHISVFIIVFAIPWFQASFTNIAFLDGMFIQYLGYFFILTSMLYMKDLNIPKPPIKDLKLYKKYGDRYAIKIFMNNLRENIKSYPIPSYRYNLNNSNNYNEKLNQLDNYITELNIVYDFIYKKRDDDIEKLKDDLEDYLNRLYINRIFNKIFLINLYNNQKSTRISYYKPKIEYYKNKNGEKIIYVKQYDIEYYYNFDREYFYCEYPIKEIYHIKKENRDAFIRVYEYTKDLEYLKKYNLYDKNHEDILSIYILENDDMLISDKYYIFNYFLRKSII